MPVAPAVCFQADSESPATEVPERFRQLRRGSSRLGNGSGGCGTEVLDPEPGSLTIPVSVREALQQGLGIPRLQDALDRARADAVTRDRAGWLALHKPFRVVERLRPWVMRADWAVLTTKSETFTAELLDDLGLQPWRLYGGRRARNLRCFAASAQRPLRSLEDRRATLETLTPGLERLVCLLVSWGYLRPSDSAGLPDGIQLLRPEDLAAPLAHWP